MGDDPTVFSFPSRLLDGDHTSRWRCNRPLWLSNGVRVSWWLSSSPIPGSFQRRKKSVLSQVRPTGTPSVGRIDTVKSYANEKQITGPNWVAEMWRCVSVIVEDLSPPLPCCDAAAHCRLSTAGDSELMNGHQHLPNSSGRRRYSRRDALRDKKSWTTWERKLRKERKWRKKNERKMYARSNVQLTLLFFPGEFLSERNLRLPVEKIWPLH